MLLARFAARCRLRAPTSCIDLGAGGGAVVAELALHCRLGRVALVERDPAYAKPLESMLAGTDLSASLHFEDVANVVLAPADLIVCNPPYHAPGAGRLPASPERIAAHFGELAPFVEASARLIHSRSAACFCFLAARFPELLATASAHGLRPRRLQFAHRTLRDPARLCLVEFRPGVSADFEVEPPALSPGGDPT